MELDEYTDEELIKEIMNRKISIETFKKTKEEIKDEIIKILDNSNTIPSHVLAITIISLSIDAGRNIETAEGLWRGKIERFYSELTNSHINTKVFFI